MLAWQKQIWVHEELKGQWSLDLNAGVIEFPEVEKRFDIQMVGMEDLVTQKWIWAWGDPKNDFPQHQLRTVAKLKQFGSDQNIPELVQNMFPLDIISGYEIATIAAGLVPCEGYWVAGDDGKFNVYFLMLATEPAPQQPPVTRATRVIGESIGSGTIADHRSAVVGYFKEVGYRCTTDGDQMVGEAPQGDSIRLTFDQANRLIKINASASPNGASSTDGTHDPKPPNNSAASAPPAPTAPINRTLIIGCVTAAIAGSVMLFLLVWPLVATFIDSYQKSSQKSNQKRLGNAQTPADQHAQTPNASNSTEPPHESLDLTTLKTNIIPFRNQPTGFTYNFSPGTTLKYDVDLQATLQQQPFELKATVGYKVDRGYFLFKSELDIDGLRATATQSPLNAITAQWVRQSEGKLRIKDNGKLSSIENGNTQLPFLLGPVSVLPFQFLPNEKSEPSKTWTHFYRSIAEPETANSTDAMLTARHILSEESNRTPFDRAFPSVLTDSKEEVEFIRTEGDLAIFKRSFRWYAEMQNQSPGYEVTGTGQLEFDATQGVVTRVRFTGIATRQTESSSAVAPFELEIVLNGYPN